MFASVPEAVFSTPCPVVVSNPVLVIKIEQVWFVSLKRFSPLLFFRISVCIDNSINIYYWVMRENISLKNATCSLV